MDKTKVIAVIGCGRIAKNAHFPALAKIGGIRIKDACDIIESKAAEIKEKYPALIENIITDYRAAIDDPEVDAVFVLTPNFSHYTVAMDALKAKKHVFCEKPITVDYEKSCEMARQAVKQNCLLNIGVCNRYNKAVEVLENLNKDGFFGDIYHIYCSFRSYRSIPGIGGDFTTIAQSGGGVLIDWGIHFLDLALYILGGAKIKTATCNTYSELGKDLKNYKYTSMWAEDTKNLNGTYDVDDFASGYIRTDKASISFNGAWAQNIDEEEMFIDFLGTKGGARLKYGANFVLYTQDGIGGLKTIKYNFNVPDQYEREDRAFLNALNTGEKTKTNIENILESAKLLELLYRSAQKNLEIIA